MQDDCSLACRHLNLHVKDCLLSCGGTYCHRRLKHFFTLGRDQWTRGIFVQNLIVEHLFSFSRIVVYLFMLQCCRHLPVFLTVQWSSICPWFTVISSCLSFLLVSSSCAGFFCSLLNSCRLSLQCNGPAFVFLFRVISSCMSFLLASSCPVPISFTVLMILCRFSLQCSGPISLSGLESYRRVYKGYMFFMRLLVLWRLLFTVWWSFSRFLYGVMVHHSLVENHIVL